MGQPADNDKGVSPGFGRRKLLLGAGASAVIACRKKAPAVIHSERDGPGIFAGVQAGDVGQDWATIWGRSEEPAQMVVEWVAAGRRGRVLGPLVSADENYTGLTMLRDLPAGQTIDYQVYFVKELGRGRSAPRSGRLRTAPRERRSISLLWSGDTCGQGFGVGEPEGSHDVGSVGFKTYATMAAHEPDLMVHCGDLIYADNPIEPALRLPDGRIWRNKTVALRRKVAETLDEFRAAYRYNFIDKNFAKFHREVATIFAWDDHEVLNNWYPTELLSDERYSERRVSVLATRAKRAFREYTAIASPTIHRVIPYGPLLDLFVLDMRSFRGANTAGLERPRGPNTELLGRAQVNWLVEALRASRATWRIVVSDMPLGLVVLDGFARDALANGDPGPPLGREHEFAELLSRLKQLKVRNTVWLTADVHYTAAHRYGPKNAVFKDFDPFWEFVSGPLHAGSFGPNDLDPTFGPELRYIKAPGLNDQRAAPSEGLQFFGKVEIAAKGMMTVTLRDRDDRALWSIDLPADEHH
ncbi:MAG TPA: alkaline phosphatase [Nannocystis exedens]|nr:alkaline phosphatase [Nannocystis exedens]